MVWKSLLLPLMCKSRGDTMANDPKRASRSGSRSRSSTAPQTSATNTSNSNATVLSSSSSSRASVASVRASLPETPILYRYSEISSATNGFLSPRLSPSSSSWRCTLRGRDVVIVQRRFLSGDPSSLPSRLSALSRAHHSAVIPLLGASLASPHLYLIYDYAPGTPLNLLLRNPHNPSFTALSTWSSRVQIAADVAQGLDYIHHHSAAASSPHGSRPVHNRIKSSSLIVSDSGFRTRICHFGSAALSGEIPDESTGHSPRLIQGTTGYMAPEVVAGGRISQSSDVFAFGVVLLELLSGRKPLDYDYQKETKVWATISLIETAKVAIGAGDEEAENVVRSGRVRRWMDGRLRDSFPVASAEKLVRLALRCVAEDAAARPGMVWVAGKVSKVLLDAKEWEKRFQPATDFSVSLAPR